jgi:NCS1 family nucleobase:cation symporter-1
MTSHSNRGVPIAGAERTLLSVDPSNLIWLIPAQGDSLPRRRSHVRALPDFGIGPVPPPLRRLRTLDQLVLWGSLNVGLLALIAGSFVVPALGLVAAVGALALGSALGAIVLGAIAALGARDHVPGMVLMRRPLGVRGSILPSLLNAIQLVGFSVFEFVVIGHALSAAFGGSVDFWIVLATAATTGLVLGGPLTVVRRVLRLLAVPAIVVATVWLVVWAVARIDWDQAAHGHGGFRFWQAVDLALAGVLSWAPLVADYARFGQSRLGAFSGTAIGTAVPATFFYSLGALLVLANGADPAIGLAPSVGVAVLATLAIAELDKPFADLYSTVVSLQNARPRWRAPLLAVALGVLTGTIALVISLTRFQTFLLLIGSLFIPLAGVLLGHAVRMPAGPLDDLYRRDGRWGQVNAGGFFAWLLGAALYQWIAPSTFAHWDHLLALLSDQIRVPLAPAPLAIIGASLPSFAVAFAAAWLLAAWPRPWRASTAAGIAS